MKIAALLACMGLCISILPAQSPKLTVPLGCYMPQQVNDRGFLGYDEQLRHWNTQVIPYEFHPDFPLLYQPDVLEAFKTLQENTNLCFVPRRNEALKINVKIFNNALYSYANLEDESINLSDFSQTTILHEIGHLLGLAHEHQRPDRGQHVAVHQQNILSGFESAFTIFPFSPLAQLTQAYDIKSIMHYPSFAFSKNGSATITDVGWNQIPVNKELSPQDIAILNQAYPLSLDCQKANLERPPKAAFQAQATNQMCSYTLYTFKNSSIAGDAYEWSAPDAVPASGHDSIFSVYFTHAGSFQVSLKAINPFGSSEEAISYTVKDCVEPAITAINPNPAADYLEFALSRLVPEDFTIRIYAMNGQEVVFKQAGTQDLGQQTYRLDLPHLPQGVYLLALEVYDTVLTRPFLVGH